jgi:hypothetical protein
MQWPCHSETVGIWEWNGLLLLLPRTITRVILGISVKSGKDSTSALSFVIHRVGLRKNLISIQGGGRGGVKLWKPSKLFLSFHPVFLFSWASIDIDFHCSYLYSYYSSSRNLCIRSLDSAFRAEFQHFILRFDKISLLYFCN